MPWYTNLPSDWQTEIEKKIGAQPAIEAVIDPDGINLLLGGYYDIVDVSPIKNERDLDIDYGSRPVIQDITLTINNNAALAAATYMVRNFIGKLDRAHSATDTTLYLVGKTGNGYGNLPYSASHADETVYITDGTNTDTRTVSGATAAAGATLYHTLTITSGLTNDFAAGSWVYTSPLQGREILLRMKMQGCEAMIPIYRGIVSKPPEYTASQVKLTLTDKKLIALRRTLTGADSDSSKKLMVIDSTGSLVTSVKWSDTFNVQPYTYSITSGALPDGLVLNALSGAITGTPTAANDFDFTMTVTNADGDTLDQAAHMTILSTPNTEFDSAYGLSLYTQSTPATSSFSLAAVEGYCRLAFDGNFQWNSGNNNPVTMKITSPGTTTNNWVLIARINSDNLAASYNGYCGLYFRFGANDGWVFGYHQLRTKIGVWKVATDEERGVAASLAQTLEFRIRKVSTTYYFDYRAVGAAAWTELMSEVKAGTPTEIGIARINDDATSEAGSADFDFLRYYNDTLAVATANCAKAKAGVAYTQTLRATGGAGEYTWTVSVGALPAGLSLSSTGVITGTPTGTSYGSFTVQVTDGVSATATKSLSIAIETAATLLQDYFPEGYLARQYSDAVDVYAGGAFDRTQVTVNAGCPLGKWTVTFTSSTEYEINGPDGLHTGSIVSDNALTYLTIPAAAWTEGMSKGDTVSFITGISFEKQKPVSVLYSLFTSNLSFNANSIGASSYFGAKTLGYLYDNAAAGATSIKIALNYQDVIPDGDTLTITEGATTEDVTVSSGNAVTASYPPYITLTVSALANAYTTAATVTWKQRAAALTGSIYTYDDEYHACEIAPYQMSITLDRTMTALEAIEVITAHMDGVSYQGPFGREHLYLFRNYYSASAWTAITNNNAIFPVPTRESIEGTNEIIIDYAYDYDSQKCGARYTFPASDTANINYIVEGQKKSATLTLPGCYDLTVVRMLAQRKHELYRNGLCVLRYNMPLTAVLARIGDHFTMPFPASGFNVDTGTPTVALLGTTLKPMNGLNIELMGLNITSIYTDNFQLGVSKLGGEDTL